MVDWRGWAALCTFVVQNACSFLIIHYSKVHGQKQGYNSTVAVMIAELIKLPSCLLLYMVECRGLSAMVHALRADIKANWGDWLRLTVPALLYTLQNVCLFVGIGKLESAVAQVTYQAKTVFTAIFSVALLGKRLGLAQWAAVALLMLGVIGVQGVGHASSVKHSAVYRTDAWIGVCAMLTAALCSAFASVYFEKMLKGSSQPSLWLRNIQLACYCSLTALISVLLQTNDPRLQSEGGTHNIHAGPASTTRAPLRPRDAQQKTQCRVYGFVITLCLRHTDLRLENDFIICLHPYSLPFFPRRVVVWL